MEKFVSVGQMKEGDVLQSDVRSADGSALLIAKGTKLTANHIFRLRYWNGGGNQLFRIETNEESLEPKSQEELTSLREQTNTHLKRIYAANYGDMDSALAALSEFSTYIYDDLRTIEDLPADAINIQYAACPEGHYFRSARMAVALASLYNNSVPQFKRIHLDSICLASLLNNYGKRFKNDDNGVKSLKLDRRAVRGIDLGLEFYDGNYRDAYSNVYGYVALKGKVPEDVRQTILCCGRGKQSISPSIATESARKAADIISICSTYDMLLEHVLREGISVPFENVISYMNQLAHNNQLDPDLYKLFLGHIPIYPNGVKVKLSNGEEAIVMGRSQEHPTKPTVFLLSSKRTVDLSETLDVTISGVVHEGTHVDKINSLQKEQVRHLEVNDVQTQELPEGDTPDGVVLSRDSSDKPKALVKRITEPFTR